MKLDLIYYLLLSNYANSVIASDDENRFKYKVFSTIFQYGPTWAKELEIQKEVRSLTAEDLQEGVRNITNVAANPSTTPSTQDTEELPYVNNQNVSKTKRSKADGYALLLSLLKDDVTESFMKRFKPLFLNIVEPERPLWYATYDDGATTDPGNIYDGVTLFGNFRNRYFSQIFPTFEDFETEWNSTVFAQNI